MLRALLIVTGLLSVALIAQNAHAADIAPSTAPHVLIAT